MNEQLEQTIQDMQQHLLVANTELVAYKEKREADGGMNLQDVLMENETLKLKLQGLEAEEIELIDRLEETQEELMNMQSELEAMEREMNARPDVPSMVGVTEIEGSRPIKPKPSVDNIADAELIELLEEEVSRLTARLMDAENNNSMLNEELEKVSEELMAAMTVGHDDKQRALVLEGKLENLHSEALAVAPADANAGDWKVEKEVLLAEINLLNDTINEQQLLLDKPPTDAALQTGPTFTATEHEELLKRIAELSAAQVSVQPRAEMVLHVEEDFTALTDADSLKAALETYAAKLAQTRSSNSKLLQKVQALRGNIQVMCRIRPPNLREVEAGVKIQVEAMSDTELGIYDKRNHEWKSFIFDRVWGPECSQSEVFFDVEALALSVIDGFNVIHSSFHPH